MSISPDVFGWSDLACSDWPIGGGKTVELTDSAKTNFKFDCQKSPSAIIDWIPMANCTDSESPGKIRLT